MSGSNRAGTLWQVLTHLKLEAGEDAEPTKPCVFISYQHEDELESEKIADYLLGAEADVYFDKYDKGLSELVKEGDPDKVTERLRAGISNSTHMICVVSPRTVKSFWVPFEVGYGYDDLKLGILTLKGVSDSQLPDYMRTTKVIVRGVLSLNRFIADLLGREVSRLEEEGNIKAHIDYGHPLREILDYYK